MKPVKDLNNTLRKIHSMFFNLAMEDRLNLNEVEDYNGAAANAFELLEEIERIMKKNGQIIEASFMREQNYSVKAKKYRLLLLMIGLKPRGIELLEQLPLNFLESILLAFKKYDCAVISENHFELIIQKYRWVILQIERDLNNIKAIKFQKRLYREGTQKVKVIVRKILMQIAEESGHIADDIRAGKTEKQLLIKIKNHWYEKLSTHNPFE